MTQRILVAGIGNIFFGDDGFGVEVAKRLAERSLPDGVRVVDFGIRGLDLVYTLLDPHDAVIFVDLASRGEQPGTLTLIEPQIDPDDAVAFDTHGLDPVKALALARTLGAPPTRTFLVACEPEQVIDETDEDARSMELSEPVRAAVEEAIKMVEALVEEIRA